MANIEARLQRLEHNEMMMAARLDTNEQSLTEFKCLYSDNRSQDMLTVADQSERLDYLSNLGRNNCVLLTGTNLS